MDNNANSTNMIEEILSEMNISAVDVTEEEKKDTSMNKDIEVLDKKLKLNTDNSTARYKSAEWFETAKDSPICIIGLGGLGSHLSLQVGRTSPKSIYLHDHDVVDGTNMSGQLYGQEETGITKVHATDKMLKNFCPSTIVYINKYGFGESSFITNDLRTIFSCVDNMETRKLIYERWKTNCEGEYFNKNCVLIDARCTADYFCIYYLDYRNKESLRMYEEEFFSDEEADEVVCSFKQTTYIASMAASMMVSLYVASLTEEAQNCDMFIPRKVEYNQSLMTINKTY